MKVETIRAEKTGLGDKNSVWEYNRQIQKTESWCGNFFIGVNQLTREDSCHQITSRFRLEMIVLNYRYNKISSCTIIYMKNYLHFKTRKHSSRMRTAHFSDSRGLPTETPWTETPWTETLPQKENGSRDRDPLKGTWNQGAGQKVTSYRDAPVDRMTDTHFSTHYLAPNFICESRSSVQCCQLTDFVVTNK